MTYEDEDDEDVPWWEDRSQQASWERQRLAARAPFSQTFKLAQCQRYDIVNKMAQRLGFKGSAELAPVTQRFLFDLYEIAADAHELKRLGPDKAAGCLRVACDRQEFVWDDVVEVARDLGCVDTMRFTTTLRTADDDAVGALLRRLQKATMALFGQVTGSPRPTGKNRNRRGRPPQRRAA